MKETTDNKITGVNSADKVLTGKEKRQQNLKPFNSLDKDRQHEIRSMGGKACQEKIRQRKTMKEQLIAFLDGKVDRETAVKYLGPDAIGLTDDNLTYQGLLTARMWQEATEKGNAKAAEFIRDTSGQKEKDSLQITCDIMTDADRALIANMADLLSKKQD
jgi:hypothetical protein